LGVEFASCRFGVVGCGLRVAGRTGDHFLCKAARGERHPTLQPVGAHRPSGGRVQDAGLRFRDLELVWCLAFGVRDPGFGFRGLGLRV